MGKAILGRRQDAKRGQEGRGIEVRVASSKVVSRVRESKWTGAHIRKVVGWKRGVNAPEDCMRLWEGRRMMIKEKNSKREKQKPGEHVSR